MAVSPQSNGIAPSRELENQDHVNSQIKTRFTIINIAQILFVSSVTRLSGLNGIYDKLA